jgi:hypothetical protein
VIFEPGEKFISLYGLHQHWYTCPIALPVRRNTLSQPLPHLCFNLFVISEIFATEVEPLYATNTSHSKQEKILYEYRCIESYCPQKSPTERCSSVVYPQERSPFWLLIPASDHAHARLLPRLPWSWTVMLPSDTHRKPFVTCLLTLPREYRARVSVYPYDIDIPFMFVGFVIQRFPLVLVLLSVLHITRYAEWSSWTSYILAADRKYFCYWSGSTVLPYSFWICSNWLQYPQPHISGPIIWHQQRAQVTDCTDRVSNSCKVAEIAISIIWLLVSAVFVSQ